MDAHSEQDGLHAALRTGPHVVVATTLATLILAGSAVLWRSKWRDFLPEQSSVLWAGPHSTSDSGSPGEGHDDGTPMKRRTSKSHGKAMNDAHVAGDVAAETKSARSKERRRRGKDPMKDLLKGGKKAKALAKLAVLPERLHPVTANISSAPSSSEPIRSSYSRDHSLSTSSRSVSSASSSHQETFKESLPGLRPRTAAEDPTPPYRHSSAQPLFTIAGDDEGMETLRDALDLPAYERDSFTSRTGTSRSFDTPSLAYSATFEIDSTSETSLSSTLTSDEPIRIVPSQTFPATSLTYKESVHSTSSTGQVALLADSWAWDGRQPPTSPSGPKVDKPPRFRPKSRDRASSKSSAQMPPSSSMPVLVPKQRKQADSSAPACSTPEPLSDASSSLDSQSETPTFPSLNGSIVGTESAVDAKDMSSSNIGSALATLHGTSNTPRRAATPQRTSNPSSKGGTPPPSLSIQTQMASLRGALEAARMREEKTKTDMERYIKELEALRWESSTWRRREAELQVHIHHLMHQLQSYANLFMSLQHQMSSGANSAGSNSPTSYQASPLPSHPQSPQGPPVLSPMMSPVGMFPPMALQNPQTPFLAFPYSSQPVHSVPPPPHHSVYSMFYPYSSSVESATSNDSIASSSSGVAVFDRGRRRTRTRTANTRLNGDDGSESWVGDSSEGAGDDRGDESSDEEEFNGVLVDAILKRPGSLKSRSKKRSSGENVREKLCLADNRVEITFPSIADYGQTSSEKKDQGLAVLNGNDELEEAVAAAMTTTASEESVDDFEPGVESVSPVNHKEKGSQETLVLDPVPQEEE